MLHTYIVTVDDGRLDIGLFGSCPVSRLERLEAADEDAARAAAREQWGRRVRSVQRLYTWAITLKGRHDGRRRETFFTTAVNEHDALHNIGYHTQACRFSRVYSKRDREQYVTKVERRDS